MKIVKHCISLIVAKMINETNSINELPMSTRRLNLAVKNKTSLLALSYKSYNQCLWFPNKGIKLVQGLQVKYKLNTDWPLT